MKLGRWLALFGKLAAVALLAAVCILGALVYQTDIGLPLQIRRLSIEGVAEGSASIQELQDSVQRALGEKNFLSVKLEDIRDAVESISWVRKARVDRVWPDGLSVHVQRHEPIALWEDGRLVSADGVLFTSSDVGIERISTLPRFSGDAAMLPMIAQLWSKFNESAGRIGARVRAVQVSLLGSWQILLEADQRPDVTVELGRSKVRSVLTHRFDLVVDYYQKISDMMQGYPTYLDARYRNAFAARLPSQEGRLSWEVEKGIVKPPEPEQISDDEEPKQISDDEEPEQTPAPAEPMAKVPRADGGPAFVPSEVTVEKRAKKRPRPAPRYVEQRRTVVHPSGIRETTVRSVRK